MSIIMFSKTGNSLVCEQVAGIPHCTVYCNMPTVLRATLLPPALGPEITRICLFGLSSRSIGTTFLPSFASEASNSGCLPFAILRVPSVERIGLPASIPLAHSAFERIKSTSPTKRAASISSARYGRRKSVNSIIMRATSLCFSNCRRRILLFISTTSIGSIKKVFPLAEASCTIPGKLLLLRAFTGMSILPSLTETPASSSAILSSFAFFRMLSILLLTEFWYWLSSLDILSSSADAESLMLPFLSSMESIFAPIAGKN